MTSAAVDPQRDPRVQQIIDDPEAYFADARRKAYQEAVEATKREAEAAATASQGAAPQVTVGPAT